MVNKSVHIHARWRSGLRGKNRFGPMAIREEGETSGVPGMGGIKKEMEGVDGAFNPQFLQPATPSTVTVS